MQIQKEMWFWISVSASDNLFLVPVKCLERFIEVWMQLGRVKNGGRYFFSLVYLCSWGFENAYQILCFCIFWILNELHLMLSFYMVATRRIFCDLQAVELQKLILAHNNIDVLKEDLKNLSLLSVLNISHNKISHLPASIGE